MRSLFLFFVANILAMNIAFSQGTAINTTGAAADNSAMLDVSGTSSGVLINRMTTAQRNAIVSPATGLMIYNADCNNFNYYNGSSWTPLNNGVTNLPAAAGTITGSAVVCQGQAGVSYSTGAIANAADYVWYYSGAGAQLSGITNPVTISFSASATSGVLTVMGSNACGNGLQSANFAITVNPQSVASVSISANPSGQVCPGTSVTFTATAVNGGSSPVYQWQVNGANTGSNSSLLTYSPQNSDAIRCIMTSNANCVTGSPDTSNLITVNHYTVPTITGTTPGSRSGAGTVTLGASASAGTINWYAAATGGSSLGTGTSFVTPTICTTKNYYVDATNNGCTTASRTAVLATVTNVFQVDNGCSLTNGLISYWKMEGNSNDYNGVNNGTDNAVSYGSSYGRVSQGANFNGTTSQVFLPNTLVNSINGGSFSFSAWVYISSYQSSPDGYACVLVNCHSIDDAHTGLWIRYNASNSSILFTHRAGTIFILVGSSLQINQWQLITGTYNYSTGLASIYRNNTLIGSQTVAGVNFGNIDTRMGEKGNENVNFLRGNVDEIGVWNKVLTSQEISDLYNSGNGQTIQ